LVKNKERQQQKKKKKTIQSQNKTNKNKTKTSGFIHEDQYLNAYKDMFESEERKKVAEILQVNNNKTKKNKKEQKF